MNCTTPALYSRLPLRRGITLLEVLVSMFVLLFGLMGVAAVFPVASFYVTKGEQSDASSSVSNRAFDEIRARGMLRPEAWWYAPSTEQQGDSVLAGTGVAGVNVPRFFLQPDQQNAPASFTPPPTYAPNSFNNLSAANGGVAGPGHAFVLDPAGAAEGYATLPAPLERLDLFPYTFAEADDRAGKGNLYQLNPWNNPGQPLSLSGQRWPVRRVTLRGDDLEGAMRSIVGEKIFTLRDDLAVDVPDDGDLPSTLAWQIDQNGTPNDFTDDVAMQPQFGGAYSWIVSVVPTTTAARDALQLSDIGSGDYLYDVSIVTFYRRVALPSNESERLSRAELLPGGELLIYFNPTPRGRDDELVADVDEAVKEIREGNWIALTGVNQNNGAFIMQWYRVLSIESETNEAEITDVGLRQQTLPARRLFLAGPDWPSPAAYSASINNATAHDLRAIILPGAISVVTRQVRMEAPSAWSVN
ncbi:MAG: prepilin-type N-terminal cleavage/methylation domain-containing protein [Planctomycetota bacterium]